MSKPEVNPWVRCQIKKAFFQVVQWLRLHTSTAAGESSIPARGTKIMPGSTAEKERAKKPELTVRSGSCGPTLGPRPRAPSAGEAATAGGWHGWADRHLPPRGASAGLCPGPQAPQRPAPCSVGGTESTVSPTARRVLTMRTPVRPRGAALPLTPGHGFEVRQPLPSPPPPPHSVPHPGTALVPGVVFQESG